MTAVGLWIDNVVHTLQELGMDTGPNAIAEQAQGTFGDKEQGLNRPLYWASWEAEGGDGDIRKSGRLRFDVILFMFYWHLQSIQGVGLFDNDNDAPPIGAYTLSIQAVLPMGQVAWFSVDNWGNTYKYLGGRKVKSPKASKFSKTIQAFTVQDWETIFTEACALQTGFKMDGKKRKVASSTGSAYNSNDESSETQLE
ncbi:hypothetical protein PHLCEN_2v11933 [Hermanssonia centrifuga]|uniref:Uncharacterized protein n=1 Tax=Hermanssonia centrifuga TaxID=98765 RepID=A0A2R6NIH7_9APHY|nr:hypothetical protein PHLCEN_2v11933 [Hermanssonia centrifuga]